MEGKNAGKESESYAMRVADLNARLQDIRREQVFQRVNPPLLLLSLFPTLFIFTAHPSRFFRSFFDLVLTLLLRKDVFLE